MVAAFGMTETADAISGMTGAADVDADVAAVADVAADAIGDAADFSASDDMLRGQTFCLAALL